MIRSSSYKLAMILGVTLYIICLLCAFIPQHDGDLYHISCGDIRYHHRTQLSGSRPNTYSAMIGYRDYATLRLRILAGLSYPLEALMVIVLRKYLVFYEDGSLESRMASITAKQIYLLRLSMLKICLAL